MSGGTCDSVFAHADCPSNLCRSNLSWAATSSWEDWGVDFGPFLIWFLRACILCCHLASAGSGEEWCPACALRGWLVSKEATSAMCSPASLFRTSMCVWTCTGLLFERISAASATRTCGNVRRAGLRLGRTKVRAQDGENSRFPPRLFVRSRLSCGLPRQQTW